MAKKAQIEKDGIEDKYKIVDTIDKGSYGIVYKGYNIKTNEWIALKRILYENQLEGIPSTALREIVILKELEHKNIVKLLDIVPLETKLYLIFEYIDKDLRKFIDSIQPNEKINPEIIRSIMHQILKGISFIHSHKILHRDIKPQNILIDQNNEVKIADFGLSRVFSVPLRPYTHEVVTLIYRAPEILLGSSEYSTPVDVWSAGLIFAEMFYKQPLFMGDSEIDQLYKIFRILGTPTEETWPGVTNLANYKTTFPRWPEIHLEKIIPGIDSLACDLISKMLVLDPNKRITANAALAHPYFKNMSDI